MCSGRHFGSAGVQLLTRRSRGRHRGGRRGRGLGERCTKASFHGDKSDVSEQLMNGHGGGQTQVRRFFVVQRSVGRRRQDGVRPLLHQGAPGAAGLLLQTGSKSHLSFDLRSSLAPPPSTKVSRVTQPCSTRLLSWRPADPGRTSGHLVFTFSPDRRSSWTEAVRGPEEPGNRWSPGGGGAVIGCLATAAERCSTVSRNTRNVGILRGI